MCDFSQIPQPSRGAVTARCFSQTLRQKRNPTCPKKKKKTTTFSAVDGQKPLFERRTFVCVLERRRSSRLFCPWVWPGPVPEKRPVSHIPAPVERLLGDSKQASSHQFVPPEWSKSLWTHSSLGSLSTTPTLYHNFPACWPFLWSCGWRLAVCFECFNMWGGEGPRNYKREGKKKWGRTIWSLNYQKERKKKRPSKSVYDKKAGAYQKERLQQSFTVWTQQGAWAQRKHKAGSTLSRFSSKSSGLKKKKVANFMRSHL